MKLKFRRTVISMISIVFVFITVLYIQEPTHGNIDITPKSVTTIDNRYHKGNDSTHKGNVTAPKICDDQCQKFRVFMDEWPAGKPKAVLYILTQINRLYTLKLLLQSIDKHFNNNFNYPIVIFHEKSLITYFPLIRAFTNSSLYFQSVSFSIPSFLKEPVERSIPCESTVGYRHMCRFQAKGVYEEPIFDGLDYYWRFDDDSLLIEPVNYDVFKYMRAHNYLYGYIWEHLDSYKCTQGLWEATERHIKQHNIKTHFFSQWRSPKLYYNNFELSSFHIWRSLEYQKYINFIDHIGGIYYFRWGDAPIKGIAVSMFVAKNQTHLFDDIGYQHGSFKHFVKNITDSMKFKHPLEKIDV